MTDPYPTPPSSPDPGQGAGGTYASWLSRVGAVIIDALPTAIVFGVLTALFGDNETTSNSFSFQLSGLPFLVYVLFALAWMVYNVGILQGRTGQSVGKKVLGIKLVHAATGKPVGVGLSIGRYFVHILDSIPCGLGYLWPLWDKENRTFADMILDTRVVKA